MSSGIAIPDGLKFTSDGLITAVVQDIRTMEVLMVAYMNRESLELTVSTGTTWFWSRSRGELWNKGATSGCFQSVKSITPDCDGDALLVQVDQVGHACHTGSHSCFQCQVERPSSAVLDDVFRVILGRMDDPAPDSYVAKLSKTGIDRILRKVGEESGEFIIAAKNPVELEVVKEAADLWFHTMVALAYLGIPVDRVYEELRLRRKDSGTEKR